jgi:flagellar basal-body rod modification protein FlgD
MTIAPTGTSSTSASGSSEPTSAQLTQLANPQVFLQLLIAELQNQDPTNPMNPSSILQQTSELSNVESMTNLTNTISTQQATGLLGRTVTANVGGSSVSGTVTAIDIASTGEPTLTLSGQSSPVSMSAITQVA